jgi:hypothetical protein
MKQTTKTTWYILAVSAAVGALASFIQTVERISFADNPTQKLACDLNSIMAVKFFWFFKFNYVFSIFCTDAWRGTSWGKCR